MAFFEPPPPPPSPPSRPVRREWDRPDNYLGQEVPIQFVLASSAKAVVAIRHLTAYAMGFEFQLTARLRPGHEIRGPFPGMYWRAGLDPATLPDEFLRIGIQFADGSKATNVGGPFSRPGGDRPQGPILQPGGGGSGGTRADMNFWVWPLPPAGSLAFVCEWPAYGISLSRHEIDSALIRTAAAQTTPLWPDEDGSGGGGGHSWAVVGSSRAG